jgi:putative endonuclease
MAYKRTTTPKNAFGIKLPNPRPNRYYFYLLQCRDGSLYSGITVNLVARELAHNSGRGSTYVRSRGGGTIVYYESYQNKGSALKREVAVKKLKRQEKLILIKNRRKL